MRSKRIFKTTSVRNTYDEDSMEEDSIEVDAVARKGKGKDKSCKGKKGKERHSGKGYEETTTEHSRFECECGNCGEYRYKAADCWNKHPSKPQGKGKGTKSKVTEISESDSRKDSGYFRWKTARNVGTQ